MFFISIEVNPTSLILLARDKALAIEIEVLKLENFPGPLFIYIFFIWLIVVFFSLKNLFNRDTILSKFSLLFEYSVV